MFVHADRWPVPWAEGDTTQRSARQNSSELRSRLSDGSRAGSQPCAIGHPSWVPFSGSRGPRHSEVQSQGDSLTESLAQKRGCLISEPLEGVEEGLWHLSGQAGGEQSGEKTHGIRYSLLVISKSPLIPCICVIVGFDVHLLIPSGQDRK